METFVSQTVGMDYEARGTSRSAPKRKRERESNAPSKKVRGGPSMGTITRKIKKEVTKGKEKKYFNMSATGTVDWNGTITDMCLVAQGDADTDRDGDQLEIRSFELNYTLSQGDATNQFRVIVLQWFPTSVPTVANIIFGSGAATAPIASYQHDNRFQFRILLDEVVSLASAAGTAALTRRHMLIGGFKTRKLQYVAGSTAGSDHLYMLLVSDSSASAHPGITYYAKLNYFDS